MWTHIIHGNLAHIIYFFYLHVAMLLTSSLARLSTLSLHLKYGHRPISHLQAMIDGGHLKLPKDHPRKLAPLPGLCPVCQISGATKVYRGPCVDTMELPVGMRWRIDFMFFNTHSVSGFIASLTIVEATSWILFEFPCCNKQPPIDIMDFSFDLKNDKVICAFPLGWTKVVNSPAPRSSCSS